MAARSRFGVVVGALALVLLLSVQSPAVSATTIGVTTTADELNSDGDCSLREAIQAANTDALVDTCPAGSGADTIVLPAGTYVLGIAGAAEDANATGDLDITTDLAIVGAGAASTIVDAARLDRVVHVDPAAVGLTAEISGVTIQHGLAQLEGFIFTAGGGILSGGTLTDVSNSNASSTTLTLNDSTVRSNTGITLDVVGGGITNLGTLTVNDSTVTENGARDQAVGGAGINNIIGATATLNSSTVNGNSTGSSGGGIGNRGTLTVSNSTVSGNTAFGGGGIGNGGTLTLVSSTVSENSVGAFGGGISNSGVLTLKNTIVGKNSALGSGADCIGVVTSAGHNLDSDGSCGLLAPGDISGVDPRLGPLAENGGLTKTHALLFGSPAIDAGSSDCPPPLTDQRGVFRPQGAGCDIGAFELDVITPSCNGKVATIVGPDGDSTVIGTADADVIVDLSGNNRVRARGGNDTICTGPGNDEISGAGGDDWVDAGDGANSVEGNAGDDRLTTGSGNDQLEGNGGDDTLTGGVGADKFRGGRGTDTATDFTPAEGDTKTSVEVVP